MRNDFGLAIHAGTNEPANKLTPGVYEELVSMAQGSEPMDIALGPIHYRLAMRATPPERNRICCWISKRFEGPASGASISADIFEHCDIQESQEN